MRPDRWYCSDPEPHNEHQHTDGPDNNYYLCPGRGERPLDDAWAPICHGRDCGGQPHE